MSNRRLSPPERAVWGQVARTVTPIAGKVVPDLNPPRNGEGNHPKGGGGVGLRIERPIAPSTPATRRSPSPFRGGLGTLDAGWDKRISKGMISPDRTIDLHGETLSTAHARLSFALSDAIACGDRLVLLITGKPARDNPRLPPTSRGVIRASIADWLASSSHASKIAAVRNAHPRHGGAGALYVIIRRAR